jgi:hypothetical protein
MLKRRLRQRQLHSAKKKRKPFTAKWTQFPRRWFNALRRAKSAAATYELALLISFKAFECKHTGQEIILSSEATGMPKRTRIRATKELIKLGLIKPYRRSSGQAFRVLLI